MPTLHFVIAEVPQIFAPNDLLPHWQPATIQGCPSSQKFSLFKVTPDAAWIMGEDRNFQS